MSSRSDSSPIPAVHGAVGELRECLAAARNLEHLVGSLHIGPKVLAQIVPDVATVLEGFPSALQEACRQLALGIGLQSGECEELSRFGVDKVEALVEVLRELHPDKLQARARLVLERQLLRTVPVIVAAVAHCELLLEAFQAQSVSLSVGELLTSLPERGSDRPHRPIRVAGELESPLVHVPPRPILRCIAAWATSMQARLNGAAPHHGIWVEAEKSGVRLVFREIEQARLQAPLPVFFPASPTPMVVAATLRAHRGSYEQDMLFLPAAQ